MAYETGSYRLLGQLRNANMNITSDQVIPMIIGKYIIEKIIVANPSVSLSVAAGGIYTTTSKGGTVIVSGDQLYSGLTGSTKYISLSIFTNADYVATASLYFSLTTPQGSAATADIFIYGFQIP